MAWGKKKKGNGFKKNGRSNGGGQRKRRVTRSSADIVQAQGVGAVTSSAFGVSKQCTDLRVWDAKLPQHLALPRAVGPYLTVRLTKRFQSASACTLFGTFMYPTAHASLAARWTNVCAVSDVDSTLAINSTAGIGNVVFHSYDMSEFGTAATVTPAAVTVQVMNPNALTSTHGIIYLGVVKTQSVIAGDSRTWDTYGDQFIQYMSPRMCSAGKIALRGIQLSSYPLNMSALADFTQPAVISDQTTIYTSDLPVSTGFAPIAVYNPSAVDIEYLVTTEFRVRFDLTNPASAGHTHKPIASDATWDRLMRSAAALGNGALDIVDAVATAGQLARAAKSTMAALL
jgi:hypothetical protein